MTIAEATAQLTAQRAALTDQIGALQAQIAPIDLQLTLLAQLTETPPAPQPVEVAAPEQAQ